MPAIGGLAILLYRNYKVSEDASGRSAPPIPIFLKGENRIAKVLMPSDFDDKDINQVIRVLEVYKRME